MKILVTGGAGFIGSHIVDRLLEHGHQVSVVDNLSTGRLENLAPAARFFQADICSAELDRILATVRPEVLVHEAAQTVVTRSIEEPSFDAHQNILGSLNVFLLAAKHDVRRIVYASSGGAVYGDPRYMPVTEDHPVAPLSYYGISKHTPEHHLQLLHAEFGLPYVVLRYANVYGPRQNPAGEAGVVAVFSRQMLQGGRCTIYGRGDKTRDYVHVSDIAAANLVAVEGDRCGTYNLGTGTETSDQQVFDYLAELLDYREKPIYAAVRKGEVYRTCLDSTRAREELGWQARLSMREGLAQTIDYYRKLFL